MSTTQTPAKPMLETDDVQRFGTSGTTGEPDQNDTNSGNGGYPVHVPKPDQPTPDTTDR